MAEQKSKLERELERQGLTEQEAIAALKQLQKPQQKHRTHSHRWDPKHIKLSIMPDTHIGSKFFDIDIFNDFIRTSNRESVDAVYHIGDIVEGMSNRDGHVYELDVVGTTAQMEYACELLSRIKQPFYFLGGNHHDWGMRKGNQGVDVNKGIEARLDNATFLGEMAADIVLAKNVKLRLTHEGNTCYALSYSGQKRINATEGGSKPQIWANGHIHKSLFMWYRNVAYIEAGCMQRQTPFMAMKGSPAMLGYWILDIQIQRGEMKAITPTWYPHY